MKKQKGLLLVVQVSMFAQTVEIHHVMLNEFEVDQDTKETFCQDWPLF